MSMVDVEGFGRGGELFVVLVLDRFNVEDGVTSVWNLGFAEELSYPRKRKVAREVDGQSPGGSVTRWRNQFCVV